ncbi:MAG: class I SAM-dependent methyltransferase [Candidatus Bathyarchaeia archaeon]
MSYSNSSVEGDIPHPPLFPLIVYQALAQQIIEDCEILEGLCVDLGSGVGMLGIQLAKLTKLEVLLLDVDRNALVCGLENAEHFKVREKVSAIRADVHNLPFKPNSVDLIVSRGSIPFWRDHVKAFREIYEVLARGGRTFIGGGLTKNLPEHVRRKLGERIRQFFNSSRGRQYLAPEDWRIEDWLREAGITQFEVIRGDPGRWIEIIKS